MSLYEKARHYIKRYLLRRCTRAFPFREAMWICPKRLVLSAWSGHVPFAAWIVDAAKPKILVELGTHFGMSYAAFCQTVMNSKIECKCYAIDSWIGDEHAGFYGEEVYQDFADFNQRYFSKFSQLLRMTFDEAALHFSDGTIDLLHIDGLHTYEAVKHDFETWRPKLSAQGVVLFHDIQIRERGFGVWRFWDEIKQHYPNIEFEHSAGLGVLFVGDTIPKETQKMLSFCSNPESMRHTQAIFSKLGEAIVKRFENEQMMAKSKQLESQFNRFRQYAAEVDAAYSLKASAALDVHTPLHLLMTPHHQNAMGGLKRIGILFGTHARQNAGVAELRLSGPRNASITCRFLLSELTDNHYYYFDLDHKHYTRGEIVGISGGGVSIWESHHKNGTVYSCIVYEYSRGEKCFTPGYSLTL